MKHVRYIILGAGPSGLTLAHSLIDRGVPPSEVIIIEKESECGGLCRSALVDGAPVDIGGGHFLDALNAHAVRFLFRFMPENEWNTFDRKSTIRLRHMEVDYPLEANLWQLPSSDQAEFLESIAQAGSQRGTPLPEAFPDWITWKLGDRIAQEYMLPYNRKIWSVELDTLGTYWLHKLPDVSFRESLRSCLERQPLGTIPAHSNFLYPKHFGYGEVWRRVGALLAESLILNCPITSVDYATRTVNGCWRADTIVNTTPWTTWPTFCGVPDAVREDIDRLDVAAIDIDYFQDTLPSSSHWIYEPNEHVPYHRRLLRSNFITGARGHWTETNARRAGRALGWRHHNEFAYPLNKKDKPSAIGRVLTWAAEHRIAGIGRWGKWQHMNSDVAVTEAIAFAEVLLGPGTPR